jgi:hypothetical protein
MAQKSYVDCDLPLQIPLVGRGVKMPAAAPANAAVL